MEKQNMEKAPEHPAPFIICPVEPKKKQTGTCCFCIPLKPACFVIGYLTLFTILYNTLWTAWTLAIIGIGSNGFKNFTQTLEDGKTGPDDDGLNEVKLKDLAYLLTYSIVWDLAWLLPTIFLLVGLHKRRPGFIKIHVAVATVRFIFLTFSVTAIDMGYFDNILAVCLELGLTGYLILMYYMYAKKLETELAEEKSKREKLADVPEISITDHFAYPKYLEAEHLVDKERF